MNTEVVKNNCAQLQLQPFRTNLHLWSNIHHHHCTNAINSLSISLRAKNGIISIHDDGNLVCLLM